MLGAKTLQRVWRGTHIVRRHCVVGNWLARQRSGWARTKGFKPTESFLNLYYYFLGEVLRWDGREGLSAKEDWICGLVVGQVRKNPHG